MAEIPTPDQIQQAEDQLRLRSINDELLAFARALDSAGQFQKVSEVIYFLEKPWKWAPEWAVWTTVGKPMDESEAGWEAFQESVDATY